MSDESKATSDPSACHRCGTEFYCCSDCGKWSLFSCGSTVEGKSFIQSPSCRVTELERENAELRQRLEAAEKLLPFAQHERSCHIITASYLVPFPRCTCGLDGVRDAIAAIKPKETT